MIIKNISSQAIVLDWASKLGIKLNPGQEIERDDVLALDTRFKALKEAGVIDVLSWDNTDYSTVVQVEMKDALSSISSEVGYLEVRVTTNEGNILSNSTQIGSNSSDISTNSSDIADNDIDIATNVSNISTNTNDIATNAADIATNVTDIAANTSGIAANAIAITNNTTDIVTNVTDIASNAADIATLQGQVAGMSPSFVFDVTGLLYTVTGLAPFVIKEDITITGVAKFYREKAGTSGSTIVNVKDQNGTTIFTTPTNKPEILASSGDDVVVTDIVEKTSFTSGDILKLDIEQVEVGEPINIRLEVY